MPNFRVQPKIGKKQLVFGDPRGRAIETLWLGYLAELGGTRVPVHLDLSTEHVIAIVGKRGSGKSFTLGVLLEGLSTANIEGTISTLLPSHAVLLLDSLNIYWPSARPVPDVGAPSLPDPLREQARLLDKWRIHPEELLVELWTPAGFAPRFLESEANEFAFSVSDFTGQDWGDLFGVDTVREPMGQALVEACLKVMSDGWKRTRGGSVSAMPDPALVDIVDCLENDVGIAKHFAPETIRAITQRFRAMSTYSIFARQGTSLATVLIPGHAAVLMLGEVPDDLRKVFVSVLSRRLLALRAATSAAVKKTLLLGKESPRTGEEVPPTWFMVDEAQNLLPSGANTAASDALVRYVREGRNYGLSFVVTTQQPSAVDSRIMAQVDTLISHQLVTSRDIAMVVDNLKSPAPQSINYGAQIYKLHAALSQLEVGQALVSSAELARATFVSVRPRISMHGGFEV